MAYLKNMKAAIRDQRDSILGLLGIPVTAPITERIDVNDKDG